MVNYTHQYTVKSMLGAIHIPSQVYFLELSVCASGNNAHFFEAKVYKEAPGLNLFFEFFPAKAVCPDNIKPSLSTQSNRLGVSVSDPLICLHASLNTLSLINAVRTGKSHDWSSRWDSLKDGKSPQHLQTEDNSGKWACDYWMNTHPSMMMQSSAQDTQKSFLDVPPFPSSFPLYFRSCRVRVYTLASQLI